MDAADQPLEEQIAQFGDVGRPTLASLYERHLGRMIALASLLGGDRAAAEDIAHDAFIRVAARLDILDRDVRFEAYLQRAVVNACRSRLRRLTLERRFVARQLVATVPAPDPPLDARVATALRELPYRQRAAVALRYLEDLSEEQTAHVLRCSPRAVNALVSRALVSLRAQIERE
ncbi:MAG TPA: sigma-70 family RNA polymerase sigma factor [Actinomycetota bacterium]|jgi:RNA polymerase sigma factor (sigma-70 family)|nr:sigma-70 family RNA polymerase sigma factor [Actinomycetota bacterium]